MSQALELVRASVIGASNRAAYVPHSMDNVMLGYGLPPNFVAGLHYVFARRNFPPYKMHMSLTGKGVPVPNQNKSGIIEFAVLQDTLSTGTIALLELTGLSWPMFFTDISTNGLTTIFAAKVVRVGTPEKRKGRMPGLDIYTFETDVLLISEGPRNLA